MIPVTTFALRRRRLAETLPEPVLLMGHTNLPRNTPNHFLPFCQDSTFRYYTGCERPDAVALLTPEDGFELFLPEPAEDDELWHGPSESPQELGTRLGADRVRPRKEAAERIGALRRSGRPVHTLPVADPAA